MTGSFPAQFVNNGTLDADVTGDPIVPVSGFAAFVNNGTFRRNGGSGTLYFDVPVINNGTFEIGAGTVRFFSEFTQKSGLFQLNGATIEGNSQFGFITFEGGQLQGNGTLSVHVRNPGGTFYPTGEMKIVGSYVQGPAATLRVDIAGFTPATDFGLLTVTPNQGIGGGVTLDGHLLVDKSGGFVPASGDRFVIATCASQCNGAFISVDGSMSPTFSSFAAGGEVVVAEPTNAAILRSKPDIRVGERNSSNGYTLHIYNPSAEILTVSNLAATLPISFTYQTGSTTGILIADPFDAPGTDSRMLIWSGSFSVAGGAEAILHFHIGIGADMTDGEKTIDWAATGSSGGQTNPLAVNSVAPIDIRTGASAEVTLGGNAIVTNDPLPKLIIRRINLATTSISINARITCPYPTPCGTLSNVYVGQMVDGKGVTIFHLAPAVQAAGEESVTNDYGFWGGTIPGEGVMPGGPRRVISRPPWPSIRLHSVRTSASRPSRGVDGAGRRARSGFVRLICLREMDVTAAGGRSCLAAAACSTIRAASKGSSCRPRAGTKLSATVATSGRRLSFSRLEIVEML